MDPRITLTIARMEDDLAETPSVPSMAAAVDLSLSRFAHLFRDETGVPPARYLHTVRMQRARVLLERTFLSVKEVMARVGFHDPSHFARDFRRFHGIAPSAVRGRVGHADPAPAALVDHLVNANRQGIARDRLVKPEPPKGSRPKQR
jgi:AraC family transcriptional regulator of arabinose operon